MSDTASKDDATKQRILKHLNNDHQQSLSYYLRHYAHLSASTASAPRITDISFSAMTLKTRDGATHVVPISPPMTSWSEARTRTVEMDRKSRAALDISDIQITEYVPPRGFFQIFTLGGVLLALSIFTTMHLYTPGTFVYDKVLPWWPWGPEAFMKLVRRISMPTIVIHLAESWWLDRSRLRKHGVERGSTLWWAWILSCYFEGRGCFVRIDEEVRKKRAAVEQAKH